MKVKKIVKSETCDLFQSFFILVEVIVAAYIFCGGIWAVTHGVLWVINSIFIHYGVTPIQLEL